MAHIDQQEVPMATLTELRTFEQELSTANPADKDEFVRLLSRGRDVLQLLDKDIAQIFAISPPSVSRWLTGRNAPHPAMRAVVYRELASRAKSLRRRAEQASGEGTGAKRLSPSQGRIARRNARRAVLGALRQVRNAMNADYPRLEREPKAGESPWVIECFEAAHREQHVNRNGKFGFRVLSDRWIIGRKHFVMAPLPNKVFTKKEGRIKPLPYLKAAKYAKRLAAKMVGHTWRIRQVSTDNVIMADIL